MWSTRCDRTRAEAQGSSSTRHTGTVSFRESMGRVVGTAGTQGRLRPVDERYGGRRNWGVRYVI